MVEEGAEQGGSLGMDAAELQGEQHGRDRRKVPGDHYHWDEKVHGRHSINLNFRYILDSMASSSDWPIIANHALPAGKNTLQ